jgi:ABC-type nitrate/sulfonate/bicarbonate transport system permease component
MIRSVDPALNNNTGRKTARFQRPSHLATWFLYLASILGGLLLWEVCARVLPRSILAPLPDVGVSIFNDIVSGALPIAFVQSLGHLLVGYVLAIAIALPLGFLMGRSVIAFDLLDPWVTNLYSIPSVAFVPFLIIWFGLFFAGRVALVFLMCVFEVLLTVIAGVRDVRPTFLDVGRSFRAGKVALLAKVILPAALPFIFAALRIGIVRGVNAMITAELFFAAVNLGGLMKDKANQFDIPGLWGLIIFMSVFGLLAQEALKGFEARALSWHIRTE